MSSQPAQTLIVVGTGAAGLGCAVAAAQHGATVHLIEKQDHLGGMLHIASGEFSGAGSRRQAERGIEDGPERHFEEVLRLSHGRVDRNLAWLTVQRQGQTVDWLDELGFEFHPDCPGLIHGHEVYQVPRTYWGVEHGRSLLKVLSRQLEPLVEEGRVRLSLSTTVRQLAVEDEAIVGVEVEVDGQVRQVRGDAVVLATGGYDANPDLRNRFLPERCHSVLVGCLDHATGDGLVMAEKVGAAVSSDGIFLPVMGMIPDPARPGWAVDYRTAYLEMAPAYRTPYEIWVNQHGRRFVAEDTPHPEQRERALIAQPDNTMHVVFDAEALEQAPVSLIRNPAGDWTPELFRLACEDSPWITRAGSLPELAEALAVDPTALVEAVEAYNRAVGEGADELGRTTLPVRLERPPFHAVTTVAASLLSRDGLAVDVDLEVLDEEGRPIPGLYAVGEVLGNNKFAGDNYVGGMSITPALTLGRYLGQRLAGRAAEEATV